jgi:DNA modification methylase
LHKSFYDVSKSDPVYNMHTYWTKQPLEVIEEHILHYTEPGETVLDCFAGTGMTGVAGIRNGRNAMLVDISEASCHIMRGHLNRVDHDEVARQADGVLTRTETRIGDLYKTRCRCRNLADLVFAVLGEVYNCPAHGGEVSIAEDLLKKIQAGEPVSPDEPCSACGQPLKERSKHSLVKRVPVEIVYICRICGLKKGRKKPDYSDYWRYNNVDLKGLKYPEVPFFGKEPQRNEALGITHVHEMYSQKNLRALAVLKEEIGAVQDQSVRDLLMFVFTGILFNTSLMSAYRKYENTSVRMGTLYIPSMIKDNNVLLSFRNKVEAVTKGLETLYAGKKDLGSYQIHTGTATDLSHIGDGTVHYAYLDPPYSDVINYSELNLVWEAWLGTRSRSDHEITVDHDAGKPEDYYEDSMAQALKEIYRVLAPGRWATVVFHNTRPGHWSLLQAAISKSGFEPVLSDEPCVVRSRSRTASQTGTGKPVQGFMLLQLRKNDKPFEMELEDLQRSEFEERVRALAGRAREAGREAPEDVYDFVINGLLPVVTIQDFGQDLLGT